MVVQGYQRFTSVQLTIFLAQYTLTKQRMEEDQLCTQDFWYVYYNMVLVTVA